MHSWMTTANGYLRLALLKSFLQKHGHWPTMILDDDEICHLEKIANFIASVYAPMFLRIHMKPPHGTGNTLFLTELLLSRGEDKSRYKACKKNVT